MPPERNRRYRARLRGAPLTALEPKPRESITKACATCGTEMVLFPSRSMQRYCSKLCTDAPKKGAISPRRTYKTFTCLHCGMACVRRSRGKIERRYCSNACWSQTAEFVEMLRRRRMPSGPRGPRQTTAEYHEARKKPCETCGALFYSTKRPRSAKFCSTACAGKAKQRNEGSGPVGRKGYRGADWVRLSAEIRRRDNHRCRNCGTAWKPGQKNFPVDHVIPWRLFTDIEAANAPDNLVTLCPSCHSRKTHGIERRGLSGDWTGLSAWRAAVATPHPE